jgi:hypothetical protein
MDEQVIAAMRRWPNVPAVYGWLRLDRRGQWFLVDRGRAGFDPERDGAGSTITSPPILAFIARNYQPDGQGRWFWQNGPQRVFVDIDLAPLVLRVIERGGVPHLVDHTGELVERIDAVMLSDDGDLFVATGRGLGVVHDLDLAQLSIALDDDDDDGGEGCPGAVDARDDVGDGERRPPPGERLGELALGDRRWPITRAAGRPGGFVPKPRADEPPIAGS